MPRAAHTRLWQLAVEATGDPCFGLEASRFATQTTLHALGYAVLARNNDQVAVTYLARLESASLSSRVLAALVQGLPDGPPSKAAVARQLGMSPRNLQRHLAEEGTSYKSLLNDARVDLARNYVREGRLSVTEIAFVLGFADTSTFSRAFKRWTRKSPRQYAAR